MTLADRNPATVANDVPAFLEALRERSRDEIYPELLDERYLSPSTVAHRVERPANGLRTVVLRHRRLDETQREALARFRLQQFLLCEWYDAARLSACHAIEDPAFAALPDDALHICVGTDASKLLGYACLMPAANPDIGEGTCLGTPGRQLLRAEAEMHDQPVFGTIPAIAGVPTRNAMETACIIRNQTSSSPLSSVAVVDLILMVTRILRDPAQQFQVCIGQADTSARKLLWQLGYPVLYAPHIAVNPISQDFYWHDSVHAQGRFWPFVVATDDLRASAHERERLEHAVTLPPREARRALAQVLHQPMRARPTTLLRDLTHTSLDWTSDPLSVPYPVAATAVI